MRLRSHQAGPIAIEMAGNSIRALQLCDPARRRRTDRATVTAAAVVELDEQTAADTDSFARALMSLLSENRFAGRRVITCLPPDEMQIKNLRLPAMPEEELPSAVEFEARERLRGEFDDCEIRFIPAGTLRDEKSQQQEVIVLAASRQVISRRLEILSRAGLTVAAVEPAANALFRPFARFLQRASDNDTTSVLVDIGQDSTQVVIGQGANIVFLKACPMGSGMLNQATADGLGVTIEEARRLRRQYLSEAFAIDSTADTKAASRLHDVMAGSLAQLGKEIALCLRYYAVTFRGQQPVTLFCSGAEAHFPPVIHRLEELSQLSIRTDGAWRNVDCGQHQAALVEAGGLPAWTTVLGMAFKNVRTSDLTRVA